MGRCERQGALTSHRSVKGRAATASGLENCAHSATQGTGGRQPHPRDLLTQRNLQSTFLRGRNSS